MLTKPKQISVEESFDADLYGLEALLSIDVAILLNSGHLFKDNNEYGEFFKIIWAFKFTQPDYNAIKERLLGKEL